MRDLHHVLKKKNLSLLMQVQIVLGVMLLRAFSFSFPACSGCFVFAVLQGFFPSKSFGSGICVQLSFPVLTMA